MPDPTAHADDMKSPDNYVPTEYVPPPTKDILPDFWWLNPWNTVLALLHKVDHLKSTSRGEQAARIGQQNRADTLEKNNRGLAVENGELRGKCADLLHERCLLEEEIKRANASLGRHYRGFGRKTDYWIDLLVKNYEELDKFNNELCAERNKAWHDLLTTKAELDALKSGEEQALLHARQELDRYRLLADEYRRERDAARDALTVAKEHIATLDASMHREQLDHAATLGYVRKVEAKLKRLNPEAKPAKKKGGAK
jgi:hypothetical protein